jgi:hypothetical protein
MSVSGSPPPERRPAWETLVDEISGQWPQKDIDLTKGAAESGLANRRNGGRRGRDPCLSSKHCAGLSRPRHDQKGDRDEIAIPSEAAGDRFFVEDEKSWVYFIRHRHGAVRK